MAATDRVVLGLPCGGGVVVTDGLRATLDLVVRKLAVPRRLAMDALASAAERRGASEEVLRSIRAIPPVDYRGRDEVVRSLRLDPASDRNAGTRPQTGANVPPRVGQPTRAPQEDRVKGAERRRE